MRTVIKTIITTVLLSTVLAMTGNVEARLKYYRYNDNIPMVEMSLNMMVAMGVLEPIPGHLVHDGNPYNRMVSASYGPYSRSSYTYPRSSHRYGNYRYNDYLDGLADPYDSYYGDYYDRYRYYGSRYGYSDDYPRHRRWGNRRGDPWTERWDDQWGGPWGSSWGSPWDYYSGNPWSSTWGSPWGNQWNSPWGSTRGSPWDYYSGNPWSSTWGSPWGNQWNSPWGNTWGSPWGSSWNQPWMNTWYSQSGYPGVWPYTPGSSALPLVPDATLDDEGSQNNSYRYDDSLRPDNNKNGYKAEKTSWSRYPSARGYKRSSYRGGSKRPYRKLNGLWIDDNGSMLGIRGNRFLWYDDNNQYTKGQLVSSPTMMKARVEGSSTVVRYHYRLRGNELVILSSDGKMHTFNRMPLLEPAVSAAPRATYASYKPESGRSYVSYSSYRSGPGAYSRSLNSRNTSDRAGRAFDARKRTHSVAPRQYYSVEKAAARSPYAPYSGNRPTPSVSRPADSDSDFHTAEAFTRDAGSGQQQQITPLASAGADSAASTPAIPLYKQYQPAAGKPASGQGADAAGQPAEDLGVESSTWTNYAGLDMNDPNTYLYSYLKDNDNKRTAADSSTDPGNSDSAVGSATTAVKSDRSNIWKPNNAYPDRRSHTGNSQSDNSAQNRGWGRAELTANSATTRFTWPDNGKPWN
jgi:hypothetical protein